MRQTTKLTESIKVNVDDDTHDWVEDKAEQKGLSKSAVVRMVLKEQVNA